MAATLLGSFELQVLSQALVGVMGGQFGIDPSPEDVGKAVLGIDPSALLPGLISGCKLTGQILAAVACRKGCGHGFRRRRGGSDQRPDAARRLR
jgi:hypothetical protein